MSNIVELPRPGAEEARLRHDLAAACRLVALFGWDDLLATHISVRLPDESGFLINPLGMLFEEIRPTDLLKVDLNGELIEPSPWMVNKAGFVIHSAVHQSRQDALCVMHLHTKDGVAVSCLEEGLLPLNQTAMLVARDIAYHEFEGVAFNLEERARLAEDFGDKAVMILRNHGTLAVGYSVADAFQTMFQLETACAIQTRVLGMGRPVHEPSLASLDQVSDLRPMIRRGAHVAWSALLRRLDRASPGWHEETAPGPR